jgi:hypothetical protein
MGSPIHNERIRKTLAKNVKAFLVMLEISENALANKCKVSQKQVNNITNARTGCGVDVIVEMATVFGCEPWQLLLEDLPQVVTHHTRLARLVARYVQASESDQDLIEHVAQKTAPAKARAAS